MKMVGESRMKRPTVNNVSFSATHSTSQGNNQRSDWRISSHNAYKVRSTGGLVMENVFSKALLLLAIILAALTTFGCAYSEYGYPYGYSYGYGETYPGYTYPYYENYNHGYYQGDQNDHHSKSYGYYGGKGYNYGHYGDYDNDHPRSRGNYSNRNRGQDYGHGQVVTRSYGHIPGNDKNQNPRGHYGKGGYDQHGNDH